jgi:hypothetical protein
MTSRDWLMTAVGATFALAVGLIVLFVQKTWEKSESEVPMRPLDRHYGPLVAIDPPPFSGRKAPTTSSRILLRRFESFTERGSWLRRCNHLPVRC